MTFKQAVKDERQRLRSLGLDDRYATFCIKNVTVKLHVSDRDPVRQPKHAPKLCNWYNRKTDTLWSYHDASGHMEPEDMRWTITTTNSSTNDHILAYYRYTGKAA